MTNPMVVAATIRGAISSVAIEHDDFTPEQQDEMFRKLFIKTMEGKE